MGGRTINSGLPSPFTDTYHRDVWRSADGAKWERVTESAPWQGRTRHAVIALNGSLCILGGASVQGFNTNPNNDIWLSADGRQWDSATASEGIWDPRSMHSAALFQNRVWILGGASSLFVSRDGDLWYSDITSDVFNSLWPNYK